MGAKPLEWANALEISRFYGLLAANYTWDNPLETTSYSGSSQPSQVEWGIILILPLGGRSCPVTRVPPLRAR